MGLWVMAGSWCADNLTDGWLPDYIAMRLDRDYEENAKTLVQVGLWVEEIRDGEPGWSFHEWNEPGRQPTKEQVLADRAAAADRQKRARDRAKERRGKPSQGESQDDSHDRHAVTTPVTHAVSHGDVTAVVTVPPTRPDPTRKTSTPLGGNRTADAAQPALEGMPEHATPAAPPQRKPRSKPAGTETTEREQNSKEVVAAFIDGAREEGRTVTPDVIKQVGATAKRILGAGSIPVERLITEARDMGRKGWKDLNVQLLRGSTTNDQGRSSDRRGQHQPYQNPTDMSTYDDWSVLK